MPASIMPDASGDLELGMANGHERDSRPLSAEGMYDRPPSTAMENGAGGDVVLAVASNGQNILPGVPMHNGNGVEESNGAHCAPVVPIGKTRLPSISNGDGEEYSRISRSWARPFGESAKQLMHAGNPTATDENPRATRKSSVESMSDSSSASSEDIDARRESSRGVVNPDNPDDDSLFEPSRAASTMSALNGGKVRVNARWKQAMWFAAQEAQRRKEKIRTWTFRFSGSQHLGGTGPLALLQALAGSKFMNAATIIATLWVLYALDIYFLLERDKAGDGAMYQITVFCLFVLSFELALGVFFKPDFFGSFYFYLDILGIISIIPDAIWVFTSSYQSWMTSASVLSVARAARAARASTSATRVIRWIPKLKKWIKKQINGEEIDISSNRRHRHRKPRVPAELEEEIDQHQSKIGRELDGIVSRHMIAVVGVVFVILIGLDLAYITNRGKDIQAQLQMLAGVSKVCPVQPLTKYSVWCPAFNMSFETFYREQERASSKVLYVELYGQPVYGNETTFETEYRAQILESITFDHPCDLAEEDAKIHTCKVHMANVEGAKVSAIRNIIMFTSVIAVLVGASMSLATFVRLEAVVPMERMVSTIAAMAVNPLKPLHAKREASQHQNEASIVEQALIKFGSLLQLGFGEAGAKIITGNMKNGRIDATLPGKVTQAIFGFCDIRNFTDCTEILQGDVVKLVNGVASYVHTSVKDNYGAPNKNIGDAFLLVWKPKGNKGLSEVANAALRSYIRMILDISRCQTLARWANNEKLQERLPGFRVRMGFGLHYGWAIEGAIGSGEKIDASYLSPHVNLASRLEAGTKQYGVEILISEHIFALLSDDVKDLCRLVDRVTVKGSLVPMALFTYDVPPVEKCKSIQSQDVTSPRMESSTFFHKAAPPETSAKWRTQWHMAMELYLGGPYGQATDWVAAKEAFEKCLESRPDDGPSKTLLNVIHDLGVNGQAPASWGGFRALTEK